MTNLMSDHFAELAKDYELVRLTDTEPVLEIKRYLDGNSFKGIDVGCGSGRYTCLLLSPTLPSQV